MKKHFTISQKSYQLRLMMKVLDNVKLENGYNILLKDQKTGREYHYLSSYPFDKDDTIWAQPIFEGNKLKFRGFYYASYLDAIHEWEFSRYF